MTYDHYDQGLLHFEDDNNSVLFKGTCRDCGAEVTETHKPIPCPECGDDPTVWICDKCSEKYKTENISITFPPICELVAYDTEEFREQQRTGVCNNCWNRREPSDMK